MAEHNLGGLGLEDLRRVIEAHEKRRDYYRRYRLAHLAERSAASTRYRLRHPERVRVTQANYRANHAEAIRRREENYRVRNLGVRGKQIGKRHVLERMRSAVVPQLPPGIHTAVVDQVTHRISTDGGTCTWTIIGLEHFYNNPRTGVFRAHHRAGSVRSITFTCSTFPEVVEGLDQHLRILRETICAA